MNAPHLRFRDRVCLVWTFSASQAEKRYRASHISYPRAAGRAEDRVLVSKRVFELGAFYAVVADERKVSAITRGKK